MVDDLVADSGRPVLGLTALLFSRNLAEDLDCSDCICADWYNDSIERCRRFVTANDIEPAPIELDSRENTTVRCLVYSYSCERNSVVAIWCYVAWDNDRNFETSRVVLRNWSTCKSMQQSNPRTKRLGIHLMAIRLSLGERKKWCARSNEWESIEISTLVWCSTWIESNEYRRRATESALNGSVD